MAESKSWPYILDPIAAVLGPEAGSWWKKANHLFCEKQAPTQSQRAELETFSWIYCCKRGSHQLLKAQDWIFFHNT